MAFKIALLAAAVAVFSNASALPQGGSQGSTSSPLVVVRAYSGGGCTGTVQTLTFGANGCNALPAGVRSAKVINYEVAGCNAVFSTTYPTCQLQGTAGILST